MTRWIAACVAAGIALAFSAGSAQPPATQAVSADSINITAILSDTPPPALSDFGFFDGAADRPAAALIPYTLPTPLFSDYADKHRFIYLPPGTQVSAQADGSVSFPVGAAIIKNFGFTLPGGAYRTIETRVLLHRANGWLALPYIWREDGRDADLRIAGARMPITMVDSAGATRTISYAVPNRNQCKTCHQHNEQLMPIGPKVRNLVVAAQYRAQFSGIDWDGRAMTADWTDTRQPLGLRARAYLDSNCAHCHNPAGSASNSGLFLEYDRPDGMATGIHKRPVAAGRGSGNMSYAIQPGAPDQSFLLYRMQSTEPGVAMPELGRNTNHDEGIRLIAEWIAAMPRAE